MLKNTALGFYFNYPKGQFRVLVIISQAKKYARARIQCDTTVEKR